METSLEGIQKHRPATQQAHCGIESILASDPTGATGPRRGLACQQLIAGSTAGALVCAGAGVQCARSAATVTESSLRAETFAMDERFVAYAQGRELGLAQVARPTFIVSQTRLRDRIDAVALSPEWLLVASDRSVNWHSLDSYSSQLPASGDVATCGEIRTIRVVGRTLYADTTFGIERFAISTNGLERIGDQVFGSDLNDPPGAQMLQRVDHRRLPVCRSLATFFREPLRSEHDRRAFDVTSDNTLWITQGAVAFAFTQASNGTLQLVARERLARGPLAIRAIDNRLYVIGREREEAVYRETLALDSLQQNITRLGSHGLDEWIRERPEQRDDLVLATERNSVELRRVR